MINLRLSYLILAGACTVAIGCSGPEHALDEESFYVPFETMTGDPPPTGQNGYDPSCFWDAGVQQTYRALGTGALVNTQGELPSMPALPAWPANAGPSACRNQALKYLIRCALPQNVSVTDAATGAEYAGWFGVAPGWQTQALDTSSEEWMTSCLLQHLNGYHISGPILLEGDLQGFQFNSTLQSQYDQNDSIAWGNLFDFDPTSGGAFAAHVCHFDALDAACQDAGEAVTTRVCGEEGGACGLVLEGDCDTACSFDSSGYWSCDGMKSFRTRVADFDRYGDDCSE